MKFRSPASHRGARQHEHEPEIIGVFSLPIRVTAKQLQQTWMRRDTELGDIGGADDADGKPVEP
jgi:hypothetical protein